MFDSLSFFELYVDSLISSSLRTLLSSNYSQNRACIRMY